jgi:hypothetical protein
VLIPTLVFAITLLIFVCSVTGAVVPSYEVDWNEMMVSWWTMPSRGILTPFI